MNILPMLPVLKMIDHCKMNWGADSRNASRIRDSTDSAFIFLITSLFFGRDVSIKNKPMLSLKYLEKTKMLQTPMLWIQENIFCDNCISTKIIFNIIFLLKIFIYLICFHETLKNYFTEIHLNIKQVFKVYLSLIMIENSWRVIKYP